MVSKPHLSPIQAIQVFSSRKPVPESEKISTSSTWKGLTTFPPHSRIKMRLYTARIAFLIMLLNSYVVQLSKTVILLEKNIRLYFKFLSIVVLIIVSQLVRLHPGLSIGFTTTISQ